MEQLNKNRIDYVLHHLKQTITWDASIENSFRFGSNPKSSDHGKIFFPLSKDSYLKANIAYYENLPVLFPLSINKNIYYIDKNKNLIFNHDLLKSAFYLLSGYHEYYCNEKDKYGRSPYKLSIQHELNIALKPIVNYYFKWISQAFSEFSTIHGYKTELVKNNYQFILTHDIDYVDKYSFYLTAYQYKELFSLGKSKLSFKQRVKNTIDYSFNFFKLWSKPNPYWNFEYLVNSAKGKASRHIFFFLEKDRLHIDSYYKFSEKRFVKLFGYLKENNCEIGIHGTFNSATNAKCMQRTVKNLEINAKVNIKSNRQHFLIYNTPQTALIHEKAGIKEDFTLGFAEQEGFRNSYCYPFNLYDFKHERMIPVIEYPLNFMDATYFYYKKWDVQQIEKTVKTLAKEIKEFGGIFTSLWHNNFNPELFKDLFMTYENSLKV